jgi:serine/threonine protein kinase
MNESMLLNKSLSDYGTRYYRLMNGTYCYRVSPNENYIVKKLKHKNDYLREMSNLLNLKHPNIIKLLDIYLEPKIKLVFEKLDTNLYSYISTSKLSIDLIQSYAYQLLRAVNYCHDNNILHRDIKTKNIVIDKEGILKLIDFGSSIIIDEDYITESLPLTCPIVTLWYRSPEQLLGINKYSFPLDMWAVGCVIAEMLNGRPIFPGSDEKETLSLIFNVLGTPDSDLWPDHKLNSAPKSSTIDKTSYNIPLIQNLLSLNPKKRMSAKEALKSDFFDNIRNRIEKVIPFSEKDSDPIKTVGVSRWIYLELEKHIKKLQLHVKTLNLSLRILSNYLTYHGEPANMDTYMKIVLAALYLANDYNAKDFELTLDDNLCEYLKISSDEFKEIKNKLLKDINYNVYPI